MNKVDEIHKITNDIAKQEQVVERLEEDLRINKSSSMKLNHTDEWTLFENTALLQKLIDEEITFLDLRLKRMEMKVKK